MLSLLPARISARIEVTDEHWMWVGQLNNKGYGLIHWNGSKRAAHIAVYETAVGPVPVGLQLDHLCRVRACVNPAHLEPVTASENQRRASEAQTHCRRAGHPRTDKNTYTNPRTGQKSCRACARVADRARAGVRR